jgi:lipid-A-disaccharide synthase
MSSSIFISAGEASGEHYGALLIDELKRRLAAVGQTASFFGMGGDRMAAAGLERVVRSEDMAVMGITEVVRHLPRIYREFRKLKAAIQERRPSVAVLIDFPDIHFKLAKELHGLGIPVIFFVSPQLWAWKKHRIELVRKYVTRMLVIFPFEEAFYRERGIEAKFVGHPLADLAPASITREQFAIESGLNAESTWIGLLPGSRSREIRANLPEMLEAGWELAERYPKRDFEFVLPLAPTIDATQEAAVRAVVEEQAGGLYIRLVRDARAALLHARASVVASGTATVEAALIGNPFVVVYRLSPLSWAIARRVVKVPHVAMANLIARKRVAPELLQDEFTATNIVRELERLLPDGPARESMKMELGAIRDLLYAGQNEPGAPAGGAIGRVASTTLALMNASTSAGSEVAVQS